MADDPHDLGRFVSAQADDYGRAIAEINRIDDPLRVTPGRHLFIPSATQAATSVP